MDAGEVFGLGHFEGDCERALLTFAAELGDRLIIYQELQFIAVGADDGGAEGLFARAGLRQLNSEVRFNTGLISKLDFLGVMGDALVSGLDQRRELGQELMT